MTFSSKTSYKQRLNLLVNKAVSSNEQGVTFPHGFEAYAKAAAKTNGKKLKHDWR